MCLHFICMSVVFTHISWHVTCMYLHVISMSLVCNPHVTRMYSYVAPHVTYIRMYLNFIRMSIVCTRMSSVCHSYVVVCSWGWFYHEPHIGSKAVMLLHDLEAKRSLFHTVCLLQWSKHIRNKLKHKSSSDSESIYCK